jgi:hypothetical protein
VSSGNSNVMSSLKNSYFCFKQIRKVSIVKIGISLIIEIKLNDVFSDVIFSKLVLSLLNN